MAQQGAPPAPQPQRVIAQATAPITPAEVERLFQDIKARRSRGEELSPEEQRLLRELLMQSRQRRAASPKVAVGRPPQAPAPAAAAKVTRPAQPLLERAIGMPGGKWWTRPEMARRLELTDEQVKNIDKTFQEYRLKLIDLQAALMKEDAIMEPLISAEELDEAKIVAQIDKITHARAELEKTNARMLFDIRRVLTPEQWTQLKKISQAKRQLANR